jgi:hypothetical protein
MRKDAYRIKLMKFHKSYEIVWDGDVKAKSDRDEPFVELLRAYDKLYDGQHVGPHMMGCKTTKDHLRNPLSALALITMLADSITETSGKLPTAPRVPKGAYA